MKQRNLSEYQQLNALSRHHGAVLFGSTFASGIRVTELAQDCDLSRPVYNRSLEHVSVFDAAQLLDVCVYQLEPEAVFVNLGEEDLDCADHTLEEAIAQYEWVLYQIHAHLRKCQIHVVSVRADHPNSLRFNQALRELARNAGCRYVDITDACAGEQPEMRAFGVLRGFLRPRHLSFCDAMSISSQSL